MCMRTAFQLEKVEEKLRPNIKHQHTSFRTVVHSARCLIKANLFFIAQRKYFTYFIFNQDVCEAFYSWSRQGITQNCKNSLRVQTWKIFRNFFFEKVFPFLTFGLMMNQHPSEHPLASNTNAPVKV